MLKNQQWEEKYHLLKEFMGEFGRLPKQTESYKGVKIGHWVYAQKSAAKKGSCLPERYQKLSELGVFKSVLQEEYEKQWDDKLRLTLEFYEQHGRLPKGYESYQGIDIGVWCIRQKHLIKYNSIPPKRLEKLKKTIFLDADAIQRDQKWQERFKAFEKFVLTHERLPKPGESCDEVNVGYWYITQCRNMKNLPNYPDEYREKMKKIISIFGGRQ